MTKTNYITKLSLYLGIVSCFRHSRADTGHFWHVTDFHYDHTYGARGLSCNEKVSMSGVYGDYWCDSPWSLVEDSVDNMASIFPKPDFILWTGDTVAHIKDPFLNLQLNVEIIQNITNILTEAFPAIPVFTSLGNHDFYPADHAAAWHTEYYNRVADLWAPLIGDPAQTELFRKGGYYSKDLSSKVRILCANTNLYYFPNPITANLSDPADQFQWMRDQLADIRAKEMKAFLTGHVPPGLLNPDLVDWMYPQHRETMMEIVTSFSDVIVTAHFGHDHVDSFKVLQKNDGSNAVAQFSAPSVTPWRYKIPGKTGEAHNPAVRLITYDRDSGTNLDYTQYFINLTDSNEQMFTNWTVLYTFTEAYDVADMSPESVKEALLKMKDPASEYGTKFCQYHAVSRYPQECTEEIRAGIYCGGMYSYVDVAKRCQNKLMANSTRLPEGSGGNGSASRRGGSGAWLMTSLLLCLGITCLGL